MVSVTYRHVIMALELISSGLHGDLVEPELRDGWTQQARIAAASLLDDITTYEFIASFSISYSLLSHLEGISQKLQGSGLDVLEAYKLVSHWIFAHCRLWEKCPQNVSNTVSRSF